MSLHRLPEPGDRLTKNDEAGCNIGQVEVLDVNSASVRLKVIRELCADWRVGVTFTMPLSLLMDSPIYVGPYRVRV